MDHDKTLYHPPSLVPGADLDHFIKSLTLESFSLPNISDLGRGSFFQTVKY